MNWYKVLFTSTILLMILLENCTITFPIIASKIDKSPDYAEVFDITKIYKFDDVKITTKDNVVVFGEVIDKKILDQNINTSFDTTVIISNNQYIPEIGDTMIITTRSETYIGFFSHIDYENIWIINEFGTTKAIKRNKIHSMTKNGEPYSKINIKNRKKNVPYEITITRNQFKRTFLSDEILKIERLKFKPFVPLAFIGGVYTDLSIIGYILYIFLSGIA